MRPLLASFAILLASIAVLAQAPNVATREATMTATVDRIDNGKRVLTLRTPPNVTQMVLVDPSVKEFDGLKVGDVITVHYLQSVVVQVRPDAPLSSRRDTTEEARKAGGENVAQQQKATVTVVDIDSQAQLIVYRTADGIRAVRYVADKSLMQGLRAGDRVEVTLTLERAIGIERARR